MNDDPENTRIEAGRLLFARPFEFVKGCVRIAELPPTGLRLARLLDALTGGVLGFLVDMPGYGFAQAPKDKVAQWTKLVHSYLTGRPNLRRVYVLVDGRHGPKANDLSVMNELDRAAVSYQVVLTKADKLLSRDLDKIITATKAAIKKRPAAHPELIVTSSETKSGIEELRAEIADLLEH